MSVRLVKAPTFKYWHLAKFYGGTGVNCTACATPGSTPHLMVAPHWASIDVSQSALPILLADGQLCLACWNRRTLLSSAQPVALVATKTRAINLEDSE